MTGSTATDAAIRFDGVGKAFAGPGGVPVHALDAVTLAVEPGAICGIIGRSGAGKSTLLRMVNGLERPTAGTVTVAEVAGLLTDEDEDADEPSGDAPGAC